jgi:ATP-dependent DNA helicase RecG
LDTHRISKDEAEVILGYDENHFRDLKAKDVAPAKLSQVISAFANTAGGELFVGRSESSVDGAKSVNGMGSKTSKPRTA